MIHFFIQVIFKGHTSKQVFGLQYGCFQISALRCSFSDITVGICWLLLIVPHDQMVGSVNAGYPHLLVCIIIEPHHTNMCCSTHPVLVCTPTIVIPNVFDLILPCVG